VHSTTTTPHQQGRRVEMNVLAHRIPRDAAARPRVAVVVPRGAWVVACSLLATAAVMVGLERLAERIG
jgi:hypothetical protein